MENFAIFAKYSQILEQESKTRESIKVVTKELGKKFIVGLSFLALASHFVISSLSNRSDIETNKYPFVFDTSTIFEIKRDICEST